MDKTQLDMMRDRMLEAQANLHWEGWRTSADGMDLLEQVLFTDLPALLPAAAHAPPNQAAKDVLAERERQQLVEGWLPEQDDQYVKGELACAASAYALFGRVWQGIFPLSVSGIPHVWPMAFGMNWWKPVDGRRNLVKAGALILAEIERLDRKDRGPKVSSDG